MTREEVHQEVRQFILKNFLFDQQVPLEDTRSLLDTGVVDSTGILELIGYLEKQYQIRFGDEELVATNFDTVKGIESIVWQKLRERAAVPGLSESRL